MRRLLAILMLALVLLGCNSETRPLKPFLATATPPAAVVFADPLAITFEELNSDPQSFLGKTIRVDGDFVRLPVTVCDGQLKGPNPQWALVADSLQMNSVGFDSLLSIVPEGISFTVEGVWTLYRGPVGCGKEPPTKPVWYIDVVQIVRPNPISQYDSADNATDVLIQPVSPQSGDASAPPPILTPDAGADAVDSPADSVIEAPTIVAPMPEQDGNAESAYPAPDAAPEPAPEGYPVPEQPVEQEDTPAPTPEPTSTPGTSRSGSVGYQ